MGLVESTRAHYFCLGIILASLITAIYATIYINPLAMSYFWQEHLLQKYGPGLLLNMHPLFGTPCCTKQSEAIIYSCKGEQPDSKSALTHAVS